MKDKDRLIIIVYVGTKDMTGLEYDQYMDQFNSVSDFFDKTVKVLFVPNAESSTTTVDCINPKLLSEKEYKKVQETIMKLEEFIKEKGGE